MLSYAGRVQLIRSVITSLVSYWLQLIPIPKRVMKHVQSLCRTYLWSGTEVISKKAPVAWEKVCDPKNAGGLRVLDLEVWSLVMKAKMLWNLCSKADKLWVKWVHIYFMKQKSVFDYQTKNSDSWIIKSLMKCRGKVRGTATWQGLVDGNKFPSSALYRELRLNREKVCWRKLFFSNCARPRALFILWLTCLKRLYTNDRLVRFGISDSTVCYLCDGTESVEHLFFECPFAKEMWSKVLSWLQIDHDPRGWREEVQWVLRISGSKSAKGRVVKAALAETVYMVWLLRNRKKHNADLRQGETWTAVCGIVAARCMQRKDLMPVILKADHRC